MILGLTLGLAWYIIGIVGFLFLASMDFKFFEAVGLFILWLIQFLIPGTRGAIIFVYGTWAAVETILLIKNFNKRNAFRVFTKILCYNMKQPPK